eukprot:2308468-Prorocentrum_lima.AAC.1
MTSSLVGSEMCIRDRFHCFSTANRTAVRSVSKKGFGEKLSGKCSLSEAVSYTHLTLPTICSV